MKPSVILSLGGMKPRPSTYLGTMKNADTAVACTINFLLVIEAPVFSFIIKLFLEIHEMANRSVVQ
jgi:hypothetical protein